MGLLVLIALVAEFWVSESFGVRVDPSGFFRLGAFTATLDWRAQIEPCRCTVTTDRWYCL